MIRRQYLILVALLGAFVAARLEIWSSGQTLETFDAFSYAYRDDPLLDRGPLVSFTGHAPRLWGAPLLFAALPDDTTRFLAQWAIGTVAWGVLAWALWAALHGLTARILAASGVLLLGVMQQVATWDFMVLSESLSISLGVLTLGLFLRWICTDSRWALALMTLSSVWWTFTRGEIRVAVAVLTAALAWIAWRRRAQWKVLAAVIVVLVVAMSWVTLITPTQSATFARWGFSGLPLDQETLLYRLRLQVLPNPEIKRFYQDELGMPACPALDQIARGVRWEMVRFVDEYKKCPSLVAWGAENSMTSGTQFALREPGLFAEHTRKLAPELFGGAIYGQVKPVVPKSVYTTVFPERQWVVPFVFGGLLIGLAAALLAGAWRKHRTLLFTAVAIVVCSLATTLAGLVYTMGENGRFGIQEAVGMRIAVVILFAVAADALLGRWRRSESSESGPDLDADSDEAAAPASTTPASGSSSS